MAEEQNTYHDLPYQCMSLHTNCTVTDTSTLMPLLIGTDTKLAGDDAAVCHFVFFKALLIVDTS